MLKDVFGPIRAKEIEAELVELVDNLQVLGYKEVKPWGEFISSMKPPAHWDAKTIEQRVSTNMLYYRSNYLVVSASIAAFFILFSPFIIFSLILVGALFFYVKVFSKGSVMLGDVRVDETKQMQIVAAVSIIFLGLVGTLQALFWAIFLSLLVCSTHMLFRARSISSKMNRAQEEVKLNMHHMSSKGGARGGDEDDGAVDGAISSFFSTASEALSSISSKASAVASSGSLGKGAATAASNADADDVENAPRKKAGADGDTDADGMPTTPYRPGSSSSGSTTSARKRASPNTTAPQSSSNFAAAGGAKVPHNPKND